MASVFNAQFDPGVVRKELFWFCVDNLHKLLKESMDMNRRFYREIATFFRKYIFNIHFFVLNVHFCIPNVHFFFTQKSTYMKISIVEFIFLVQI